MYVHIPIFTETPPSLPQFSDLLLVKPSSYWGNSMKLPLHLGSTSRLRAPLLAPNAQLSIPVLSKAINVPGVHQNLRASPGDVMECHKEYDYPLVMTKIAIEKWPFSSWIYLLIAW
jgi:hypothetical protein